MGAHLVTVNDYLARRDAAWMGPIFQFLGLTVSCLQHSMSDSERKEAYRTDILYATNNELGFDYLRDNMQFLREDLVQQPLAYAIVDEVDSILIDEARTPLIISGPSEERGKLYVKANLVVSRLKRDHDYDVDEKARTALLREDGMDKVEAAFGVENLYAIEHMQLLHHINQALRANSLYKQDVDYVVKDKQVLIVDEFTGRILIGRRYSDGLHQALEAKEGVPVESESQTLAAITIQNFFRLYKRLAGMTGTAVTEAEEFHNIYKLNVISIPTNEPMIRDDKPDLIFLTKNAKYNAIVTDVKERHYKGQPVLIGTVAIETSELLSSVLKSNGVPHDVLNAKQHQHEAEIIAHAGKSGRVTIATNMAGRGTDIMLTKESIAAGGLYVLGTERHESRRIDNQLRGRSGRQGDPGESRFYISLDDDLIRIFAGDSLKHWMKRMGMQEDEIIESRFVSKSIERSQEKVEKHNFEIRKHVLEYDTVLNQQRTVIYQYRYDVLKGEQYSYELIRDFIIKVVQDIIAHYAPHRAMTVQQVTTVYEGIHQLTNLTMEELQGARCNEQNSDIYKKDLINLLLSCYDLYRKQYDQEIVQQIEKGLLLKTIDYAWKQHMLNLDHLKEGIGLRGWGQKNPLIEYKREAFAMFREMMEHIRFDVVRSIFRLNFEQFDQYAFERKRKKELDQLNFVSGQDAAEKGVQKERAAPKVGRNDPCPCGSGKKHKRCCGA